MPHDEAQRQALRAFFAEAHRLSPPPPPFHALLPKPPRRASWRPRPGFAVAGAFAALAVLLLLSIPSPWQPPPWLRAPLLSSARLPTPVGSTALVQIGALDDWQGPLDFLLQTPGSDLLAAVPHLDAAIPTYSFDTLFPSERRFHE